MSGRFQASNKIQIIACVALVILLMVGFILTNLYIIIFAVLFAAIVLSVLEILYTEKNILNRGWRSLVRSAIPTFVLCVICAGLGMTRLITCSNFFEFVVIGMLSFTVISLSTLLVYYIVDKITTQRIISFVLRNIIKTRKT